MSPKSFALEKKFKLKCPGSIIGACKLNTHRSRIHREPERRELPRKPPRNTAPTTQQ